ncbi:MAG: isopenicillin N synthase family oxygenase [Rhodospirillales bacterium]|nr:isopenicillin N synthase family oxygenase [Rhodospirillales bacterium]
MSGAIPVIDLGPYIAGAPGSAGRIASELRHIQEKTGYYCVINHGIDMGLVRGAIEQVRRLHGLPLDERMKLKVDERSTGYIPLKSSVYVTSPLGENDADKRDLNENFRIVRERAADHPSIMAGRRFTGPNKWPAEELLPEFKARMLAYFDAAEKLGRRLLPLYAMALGLEASFFDPYFTDPTWMTRNVHYPPLEPEDNQFAASPHRDHSFITLLPMSKIPGLQFRNPEGAWMAPAYVENAIVVNGGEFMENWTNGRFIATPHRVLAPLEDRYIIAFFFNPNWDVVSDPLPGCTGPDRPPAHRPVQFLKHLCDYVDGNYVGGSGGKLGGGGE